MAKKEFPLGRKNLLFMAVGFAIVIVGLFLMMGSGTTSSEFNPDIFSVRRIVVAPVVTLSGFIVVALAILIKPSNNNVE